MEKLNSLNSYFNINIRNDRFNADSFKNLKIKISNADVNLINLSDSGLSFTSSTNLDNQKVETIDIYNENTLLAKLDCEFVRKNNNGLLNEYAYTFTNEILSENFVQNLKLVNDIDQEISAHKNNNNSLNMLFVSECFLLLDYLKNLKKKCDEYENNINIQSLEAKISAVDLAIKIFGQQSVDIIKKHSHKLDALLANTTDKDVRNIHSLFFREHLGEYFILSAFTGRAYRKPRGYAGDYEMMNQIYRQSAEGNSLFEKIIHLYGINENSSQSVILRKHYLKEKINNLIKNNAGDAEIIIGTLACGPAREIVEVLDESIVSFEKNIRFVLMDQDHHALLNAKRNISKAVKNKKHKCEISFLPLSVKQILDSSEESEVLNIVNFDLLYTAGLYDYLPQTVARNLTSIISKTVKNNGELIIGNFHPDNPTKTISDLICDWRLIHRNHDQMQDLISTSNFKSSKFYLDKLGIDLFIEASK